MCICVASKCTPGGFCVPWQQRYTGSRGIWPGLVRQILVVISDYGRNLI